MGQALQIGSLISQHQNNSVTANLPATSRLTSHAAIALRNDYADAAAFINTFAPAKQYSYCAEERRCYMGKAPSLVTVGEAFGKGASKSWLAFQLRDLSEFSGAKNKLSIAQIDDITEVILSQFAHLKVTELMHFFLLFKSGRFGQFYGAVDGLAIMEALRDFVDERNTKVDRWRREEADREKEAREAEAARELEALRERYARRVPDAFTAAAPLNFLQYRLMGYDSMTDDELAAELDAIRRGAKRLPDDVTGILNILKLTHDIH